MIRRLAAAFAFTVFLAMPAAALKIDVTIGDWRPINIFIEVFIGENVFVDKAPLSDIIAGDLSRSGVFHATKRPISTHRTVDEKRLGEVRGRGGEYLLTGKVTTNGRRHQVLFELFDALTENSVGAFSLPFTDEIYRLSAHNISNWIYENIARKPGVFHTKIAYVLRYTDGDKEVNELKIADYDGHNSQVILSSQNDIISPAWSPDGNELLYVSFERDKPVIYWQSLLTGERRVIANFKGSNSAPAMSPDKRRVAAALTVHGGIQQIYLLSENSKQRLHESDSIQTEPSFSSDGGRLLFVSDSSGSPQIYEYRFDDGDARRLTFGSHYNASAQYAADGRHIVFIRRVDGGDNVAVLDTNGGEIVILTDGGRADSPSWSPNDDFILFKDEKTPNYLFTVSVNGKITVPWSIRETGMVIDPVWSPISSDWF